MTDVVYVLDMSGKIVFVNKAIKKVFGFRPEEVIGKRVANFIPKRNLRLIGDFFKKIARGEEVTAETVIIDKKGKLNEIEVVSRPLTGAGSMEVYGIVRSVVDKKRAKEDLEKFKLAVENAYDNIIITDPDGVVIFANQAIEKVTGFSVREVLGKKAGGRNMWGGLMPYGYYQDMWRTIKKEKKPFVGEIKNRRKNGEMYDAEINAVPILGANGEVLFFVGIERDITELKRIDRTKTELISLASHQLRTPLSTVKWYTEMLLSGDAGQLNDEQRKYMEEIYSGNQRMIDLVNALLNVSRIDLGTLAIEPEPTNLITLAESVFEEFQFRIKDKNITIKTDYDKTLSSINIDPKLMRIIFQNIISNAIRYTSKDGKISLGIIKQKPNVFITVKDNGCGIPKNQQSKIFERLFRADNVRAIDAEGNGLGLYIVKKVLDQAGGKIWFESQEGRGTTFYVNIPLGGMKSKEGTKGLIYSG